jgi:hypothetical protein
MNLNPKGDNAMKSTKTVLVAATALVLVTFLVGPALAAISPHSQAVIDGTLLHKGAKDYAVKVDAAKAQDGKPIDELKGKELAMPADKAGECEKLVGKKVRMTCSVDADGKCTSCSNIAERKIKYFKSTMMKDETSPTSKKDSMGMDMAPVYEDETAPSNAPAAAPKK